MLDKTIPFFPVFMIKDNLREYPEFTLPSGYDFCMYQEGFQSDWARIQAAVDHFGSINEALEHFEKEFLVHPDKLVQRCIFVKDARGSLIGTVSLWEGEHFGETMPRVHWLAVHPEHQGKGIAKALMTRLLEVCNSLGYEKPLYLITQTWSYVAINMYLKFGFKPYLGEKPVNWSGTPEDFQKNNAIAWELIMNKLKEYA